MFIIYPQTDIRQQKTGDTSVRGCVHVQFLYTKNSAFLFPKGAVFVYKAEKNYTFTLKQAFSTKVLCPSITLTL